MKEGVKREKCKAIPLFSRLTTSDCDWNVSALTCVFVNRSSRGLKRDAKDDHERMKAGRIE